MSLQWTHFHGAQKILSPNLGGRLDTASGFPCWSSQSWSTPIQTGSRSHRTWHSGWPVRPTSACWDPSYIMQIFVSMWKTFWFHWSKSPNNIHNLHAWVNLTKEIDIEQNNLSVMLPKNENPASDNKSIASCFPSFGSPKRISNDAVGIPCAFMHFDTHPSPLNTSMNLNSWGWSGANLAVSFCIHAHMYETQFPENPETSTDQSWGIACFPILIEDMHTGVARQQDDARHQHLQANAAKADLLWGASTGWHPLKSHKEKMFGLWLW